MANNRIQIKRSATTATPTSLLPGELAFSNVTGGSGVLFIGDTSNTSVVAIGGVRNPGTLTANQALVVNSTSAINQVIVGNLAFTGTTQNILANGGVGTAGFVLASGGTGSNLYWINPSSFSINVNAQYVWTNTQTFQNTITFGANLIADTTSVRWVGNTTTSPTVTFANSGTISVGNSSTTQTTGQILVQNTAGLTTINAGSIQTTTVFANVSGTTGTFTGLVNASALNVVNQTNTATLFVTTSANVGTAFTVTGSQVTTTVNTSLSSGALTTNTTVINGTVYVNATGFSTTGNANAGTVYVTGSVNATTVNTTSLYATGLVNAANFSTTGNANAGTVYVSGSVNATTVNTTSLYATGLVNAANFSTTGNANAGTIYVTGSVNATTVNSTSVYATGTVNASSFTAGATGTGTGGTIQNTTTMFLGNNTINTVITSAGLNINTVTIANSTGVYTGVVNGSSLTVGSNFIANTTKVTFTGANIDATSAVLNIRDINATGNLIVSGTVTYIDTTTLAVKDNMVFLGDQIANTTGAFTDNVDTGIYTAVGNTQTTLYSGFSRIAALSTNSNPYFKIFQTGTVPGATTIDASANIGTLQAYLQPYGTGTAFVANSLAVTITANSTVNVNITANSLTLSTPLAGTSGGTGRASWTNQDLLVANATNGINALALNTIGGYVLQTNGTAIVYDFLDGGTF